MRAANSNGNIVMIHNTILPHYLSIQDECSNCQYATLLKFFQYSAAISLFAIVPLFYIESGMKVKLQPLPVLIDFLPTLPGLVRKAGAATVYQLYINIIASKMIYYI